MSTGTNAVALSWVTSVDRTFDPGRRSASNSPDGVTARVSDSTQLKRLPVKVLPRLVIDAPQDLGDALLPERGHSGADLGVVKVAVALHYAFEFPPEELVWDTGHQCHPHKILTGRRDSRSSTRQRGGLSGFPWITDSDHFFLGVGHAGSAINAAPGHSVGRSEDDPNASVVAIVGNAALTAGVSLEALNQAGANNADLVLIVNHSDMSMSPAVGALQQNLNAGQLLADRLFWR